MRSRTEASHGRLVRSIVRTLISCSFALPSCGEPIAERGGGLHRAVNQWLRAVLIVRG